MMDKSLRTLGQYAASLTYEDLPKATVQAVKQRIIDSLGCALGGYLLEAGKAARHLCPATDAPFSARIIGSLQRTTPEMAAFANATMVRDLDHSDVYHPTIASGGHPSNSISAPLAVADAIGASGKSLVTAVALAYEMYVPFLEGKARIKPQFEVDGLMATFGSAMAAGKLLGLNAEQLSTTASLTLIANVGLGMRRVGKVSMYKEFYAGMAARQGIFCAMMAQAGVTAPEEAIESDKGGLKHVVMTDGVLELGRLAGKKKQFMIEKTIIKAFPIGGGVHLSAYAAVELRKKVRAGDIKSIVVKTEAYGKSTSAMPQHWHPTTRETADHSIPVAVAITLLDGAVTAESWKKERYKAPEVLDLIARISVEENPEFTRQFPAKKNIVIEAKMRDGKTQSVHLIRTAKDDTTSDEAINAKFLRYASDVLTHEQGAATLESISKLERLERAGDILDHMRV